VRVDRSHPTILFEPGKCIRCSRCVRLCAEAGEPWGLTEIHRGHETVIAPPLGRRLAEALTVAGSACVEACPTGALAWKQKPEAQP
jgi:predicted molibdopterin-dependent oxidoreductase YjgC